MNPGLSQQYVNDDQQLLLVTEVVSLQSFLLLNILSNLTSELDVSSSISFLNSNKGRERSSKANSFCNLKITVFSNMRKELIKMEVQTVWCSLI